MGETTIAQDVFQKLKDACELMRAMNGDDATRSRELSVSITELETAIMWFNKHRTVKGEFTPTDTHV